MFHVEHNNEKWLPVVSYEGLYEVSDLGRVKSLDRTWLWGKHNRVRFTKEHEVKYGKNSMGYLHVGLCKDGKAKTLTVHRLVALAFISNPENKKTVNHINNIRTDNRVSNLEWNTIKENTQHYFTLDSQKSRKLGNNGAARTVLDTQTGIYYDCITEAAAAKGMSASTLHNHLCGRRKINISGIIYV